MVPGLSYRNNGGIVSNAYLRQSGNIDIVPDFTDLNMEDYRLGLDECKINLTPNKFKQIYEPDLKIAILPYHFIKGCPESCAYCYWNREKLFKVTRPEKVADNLQLMQAKYKVNNFIFLNNAFNPTLKYAEQLVVEIGKRKLNICWSDSVHPAKLSRDIISGFKEIGCRQLYYGIESLSTRILNLINRPSDTSKFSLFLKESHEQDIFNGVNFLIGIPFEKNDDLRLTVEFAKKNKKYFEFFNVNLLRIIPEFGITKNPAHFGIKLKDFGSIELRNKGNDARVNKLLNFGGISNRVSFYSFDEINGLDWEHKNKQDLKYLQSLSKIMDSHKKEFFDDIRFIFYLNHLFKSKKEILSWYDKLS